MKYLSLKVCLLIVALFGGVAVAADFDKGMNAYDSGDFKAALAEWVPLAEQGDADAQSLLGDMYIDGEGVLKNYKKAFKWFTLAAEQGHADAQHNLGYMYAEGEGVLENDIAGEKWETLAAEQGHAQAQHNLGYMYAEGEGVLENYKTAAKWYTLAAEQGFADSQYNLALMFIDGEGVLENHKTAYRWAKLAAAQGDGGAQSLLGELAMNDEDWIRSYMWYSLAIYNDAEDMSEIKDSIKELMTSADVNTAQEMARRCLESGYTDCWMIDKEAEGKTATQQLDEDQQALISLLVDEQPQANIVSGEVTAAVQYIRNEIIQKWVRPANARNGMVVELVIQLLPTGEILSIGVSYRDASATDAFVASVVKAVNKVGRFDKLSELDPALFDANFRKVTLVFKPEDLRL